MISNEFGGSKADTAVKLALMFFIALFSFSVGTFVGKQVSDTERRRAALEEDYGSGKRSVASEGNDEKETLSKEDVESLTKEFLAAEDSHSEKEDSDAKKDDSHAKKDEHKKEDTAHKEKDGYKKVEAKKDDSHAKKDEHQAKKEDTAHKEKVSDAAKRVAKGKTPTPAKKKARKVSSVLPKMPPTAIGKYTVQVSSYPSEGEAKKHAKELKESGYSAFYIPAVVKGTTWYRVSIGLFDSYKSANYFRKELTKQAKMNSTIIQKIVK